MTERTWKIRDQLPNGKWGPEREVTLAQYRAEINARRTAAQPIADAWRRGDIEGVATAQKAMRERFPL